MSKQISIITKGISILGIVLYHIQYDIFSLIYLIRKNEGLEYFLRIYSYIREDIFSIFPFIAYFGVMFVNVFIILSGYGLTKKYLTQNLTFKSYTNQIKKILIPYFIAIPVTFLINYLFQIIWLKAGVINSLPNIFEVYKPIQYVNAFFVPTRWVDEELALNFVGTWWFVGMILQLYLLFPLFLWVLKKLGHKKFLFLCLMITFVYRFIIIKTTNSGPVGISEVNIFNFIQFPSRLSEFALGMFLATDDKYIKFFTKTTSVSIGLIIFILGVISSTFITGYIFSDFLIGFGLVILTIRLAHSLRDSKIFTFLGNKSYQIYLYHEPLLKMIFKMLFPTLI